jgi:anti-sigma B factor antagonist
MTRHSSNPQNKTSTVIPVHVTSNPDASLTLRGDLDLATADTLRAAVADALRGDTCTSVVLDLAEVTFIDSTGLGTLVAIRNECLDRDIALSLRRPSPTVRRLLQLSALDTVFTLTES